MSDPRQAADDDDASGRAGTPADLSALGAADSPQGGLGIEVFGSRDVTSARRAVDPADLGALGAADRRGVVFGVEAGIAAAVRTVRDVRGKAVAGQRRLLIVAVDGPSGSGKSSLAGPLADALAASLGGDVIQPSTADLADRADPAARRMRQGPSYLRSLGGVGTGEGGPSYLDDDPGHRPRIAVVSTDLLATWEHPFDWWPTLEDHLLQPLAEGGATDLPTVAWVNGAPADGGTLVIDGVDVLVLEGVSAGRRALADRLTALVWVEVPDAAERLERAVGRDGEASRAYLAQWQRDEEGHFREDGTRDRATVVIDPR